MLDIKRIVNEKAKVEAGLLKRMNPVDLNLDELIELNEKVAKATKKFETARAEQNSYNDEMAKAQKGSDEFKTLLEKLKAKAQEVKTLEDQMKALESELTAKLEVLPNVPAEDVVAGEKEANEVVRTFGEKPTFNFPMKDHATIAGELGMMDYERGAKLSGNNFVIYRNWDARLEWAFINYFINEHIGDGYEFILPPHLVVEKSAYTAGQLPKFRDDVYWVQDDLCLVPTAETAIANLFRDEVIPEEELPKKLFGYTPCYRREAGSYRKDEKGTIRMHQFNKVEMFQYTTPETSYAGLDELVGKAERLVDKLGLHFRTSKLAAGDCSAGAAKTYDIEVWIPSLDRYYEVSSASNVEDYQARRGNIKYKPKNGGKTEYLHMLNASGLATSRLMVALLEAYQNEDGSVTVPEVLRPFVGTDKITKDN